MPLLPLLRCCCHALWPGPPCCRPHHPRPTPLATLSPTALAPPHPPPAPRSPEAHAGGRGQAGVGGGRHAGPQGPQRGAGVQVRLPQDCQRRRHGATDRCRLRCPPARLPACLLACGDAWSSCGEARAPLGWPAPRRRAVPLRPAPLFLVRHACGHARDSCCCPLACPQVAREVELEDPVENIGAKLVRQVRRAFTHFAELQSAHPQRNSRYRPRPPRLAWAPHASLGSCLGLIGVLCSGAVQRLGRLLVPPRRRRPWMPAQRNLCRALTARARPPLLPGPRPRRAPTTWRAMAPPPPPSCLRP